MSELITTTDDATTAEPSLLNIIAAVAQDPNANINNLRELIQMQREVMADRARVEFEAAMVRAQSEMPAILRDAENSHTRSRYAKLETIDARIRPVYSRHGFSLSFDGAELDGGKIEVICHVGHTGGHTKTYRLKGDLDTGGAQGKANKTAVQGLGSTVTYLRRYLTCMIFNIVLTNEDRDGNGFNRPEGPISAQQKDELIALLQETQSDTSKFLSFFNVQSVDDLPAARFTQARGMLMQKKQKDTAQ